MSSLLAERSRAGFDDPAFLYIQRSSAVSKFSRPMKSAQHRFRSDFKQARLMQGQPMVRHGCARQLR